MAAGSSAADKASRNQDTDLLLSVGPYCTTVKSESDRSRLASYCTCARAALSVLLETLRL